MVSIKRSFLFISFTVFILSGILVPTELSNNFINLLIFIPGISVLLCLFLEKGLSVKLYFHPSDILYGIFITLSLLSSIINIDLINFLAVLKLLFYYLVLVTCQKNLQKYLDYEFLFKSFFIVSSLVYLFCYVLYPPSLSSSFYSGIFSNSNNFGVFSATTFVIMLGYLIFIFKSEYNNRLSILISIVLIIVSFFGVIISSSRTAFVGIIIAQLGILFGQFNIRFKSMNIKIFRTIVVFFLIVTIIFIFIRFTPIYDIIYKNIIQKFIDSIQANNITTDRTIIWTGYIENSKLFGTKSNYMINTAKGTAHNSYLEQIGRFGWIAGSVYIVFWFYNLIYIFKLFKKYNKNNPVIYISLGIIILYISMSFVELLTHVVPMYLALFAVGNCALIEKNINLTNEEISNDKILENKKCI